MGEEVGEVIDFDIDKKIQEEGLEQTLAYLENWLGMMQAQIDMIEMLIKGLRE